MLVLYVYIYLHCIFIRRIWCLHLLKCCCFNFRVGAGFCKIKSWPVILSENLWTDFCLFLVDADSRFTQQELSACKPILTPGWVWPRIFYCWFLLSSAALVYYCSLFFNYSYLYSWLFSGHFIIHCYWSCVYPYRPCFLVCIRTCMSNLILFDFVANCLVY
jgi:hypothetical protein